jgi:hypothetical protein
VHPEHKVIAAKAMNAALAQSVILMRWKVDMKNPVPMRMGLLDYVSDESLRILSGSFQMMRIGVREVYERADSKRCSFVGRLLEGWLLWRKLHELLASCFQRSGSAQ